MEVKIMAKRLVLDLPEDFYERIEKQLANKKPEYVKAFIFDQVNKALNNIEGRQSKTINKHAG
jgi:hypothetical protein